MNWTQIYAFLVVTFVIHVIVFAIRFQKTRERLNLILCGAFTSLVLMFYLKYRGLDWPLGLFTVQLVLRMIAGGCTLLALYLGLKKIRKNAEEAGDIPTPYERREKRRTRRESRRSRRRR